MRKVQENDHNEIYLSNTSFTKHQASILCLSLSEHIFIKAQRS